MSFHEMSTSKPFTPTAEVSSEWTESSLEAIGGWDTRKSEKSSAESWSTKAPGKILKERYENHIDRCSDADVHTVTLAGSTSFQSSHFISGAHRLAARPASLRIPAFSSYDVEV
ncbi:hypothetical protein SCLCIDRAFT_856789 [Scleroderma citrinum Foug A]|uniref:Uncharacterized protein n=1 Tax=Scleroderma citrinum Foug A TaxID=1036808 RepID=A0A0C3E004_9AGAM|nr:hypothetical protein SCLCIDRAFT_856789 [Scleroderma citrinum Foug A]